jgi:hypothetical protein
MFAAASFTATVFAAPCPRPDEVAPADLLGDWRAQIDGQPPTIVHLARHPESTGTARGWLDRDGQRIELAGDVDEGELTLEESRDGKRISAVWLGDVVEGSCGREIRGTWKAEGTPIERPFVLRKQP